MSAPPTNPIARQLHIKLGVVQRTAKELAAYQAELITNRDKVAAMRARGADEYDIKKQVRELPCAALLAGAALSLSSLAFARAARTRALCTQAANPHPTHTKLRRRWKY